MADMISILNVIRENASTEYQTRVPLATQTNIATVGNPIITESVIQNEFLSSLINRIALTVIRNKTFKNPLAILKKGTMPLGSDIQEIFVNMAEDKGYVADGSKMLTVTTPDVKTIYHRKNRQSQYPVTIYREQLKRAFVSYSTMESFLSTIITSMYSGDEFDEFILMKNTFASAIADGKITSISVPHVDDETSGKAFVKAVKKTSSAFTFPSSAFNKYASINTNDTGNPVTTWTPTEDQLILIRADIMDEIDVEVLASAFNLDKLKFMARCLKVDSFGSATNVLAILMDRSALEVRDELYETTNFYNAQGMYWNYWLNHWQLYSLSLFANIVAFTCEEETITLASGDDELTIAKNGTDTITATVTPSGATVSYISSNSKIATVTSGGVVTGVKAGKCTITSINGCATALTNVTVTES